MKTVPLDERPLTRSERRKFRAHKGAKLSEPDDESMVCVSPLLIATDRYLQTTPGTHAADVTRFEVMQLLGVV